MFQAFSWFYRHTFQKISWLDSSPPVQALKRLKYALKLSLTNRSYARALFTNATDKLPLGPKLKHRYHTIRDGFFRAKEVKASKKYVTRYRFKDDELRALAFIIDKLELAVPPKKLLGRLTKIMTRADLDNLLALLHFVLRPHSPLLPENQSGAVIRTSDLKSSTAQASYRRNILFITGQFPNPIHGGGSRLVDFIKILSGDHNIYLYSWFVESEDAAAYQALSPYCQKIERVHYVDFENSVTAIKNFIAGIPIDIVHYEWPRSLTNFDPSLGRYHIFTFMEAVSLRLLLDLAFERPFSSRWLNVMIDLINTLKVEVVDAAQVDSRIVVTHKDGEFLARFNPKAAYVVLNHGISLDDFCLSDTPPDDKTLMFVGNYLHYPNADAMQFFFGKIFKQIKAQVPDFKIYLVGANPTKQIRAYHDNRQVFVTGTVEDIRPYIQQAAVCIAPLITGAGIRTKVIQYAALKRVCIATPIAAADLVFENGKDIFITDDPAIFAEKVVYLLKNPTVARTMSETAYETARLHYDNRQLVNYLCCLYEHLDRVYPDTTERLLTDKQPDLLIFTGFNPGEMAHQHNAERRTFYFWPEDHLNGLISIEAWLYTHAVEEAVCMVQHPIWKDKVLNLQKNYGWKIVVDRPALDEAVSKEHEWTEAKEQILNHGDLIITPGLNRDSEPTQIDLWRQINSLYGKASIIIVSYNNMELLQQCINSILKQTIYPNYEIIIVDNNSADPVKSYLITLRQMESKVHVILNDTNKGFAAANNQGIQLAQDSEFVVLLNNDTVVPRGWLCRLLRHARRPEIGLIGPVTNWTGNEAKIEVNYTDLKDMPRFAQAYTWANEGKFFDIRTLAMYCVALRKTVLDQIGPLDERFGMGMFEDEDYAHRVRLAGYRVICAEDVFVHHHGQASFSQLKAEAYQKLFEQNKQLYEAKWNTTWQPYKHRSV